jgi:stress response protein SCP2
MSVNLVKGQKINLAKEGGGELKKVIVGLGWDVNDEDESNFDCDACAVLLGADGKTDSSMHDIVWWHDLKHSSGAIWHTGDNLTGEGEGDDEQIVVDLAKMPAKFDKIVVAVSIYDGTKRGQHFGMIRNAFVRAVDADTNKEIFRYDLTDNYSGKTGMIFGEIYRHSGQWKFNAIGEAIDEGSRVEYIARRYV